MREQGLSKKFVEELSKQNKEFAIIALTGKIGSGVSDVCKLLTDVKFKDNAIEPVNTPGYSESEIREFRLIHRYLEKNWKPFVEIRVTSVIVSFLLDSSSKELKNYKLKINSRETDLYTIIQEILDSKKENFQNKVIAMVNGVNDIIRYKQNWSYALEKKDLDNRCIKLLESLNSVENLLKIWKEKYQLLVTQNGDIETFIFCYGIFPVLGNNMKEMLGKEDQYVPVFQDFGNNIRASKKAINNENKIDAQFLFCLPERLNLFIKVLRQYRYFCGSLPKETSGSVQHKKSSTPIFIVITNLKNTFEAFYFKRRYSAFYLMAVCCDEKKRKEKFRDISRAKIADLKENLSSAKKVYKAAQEYFEMHNIYKEEDISSNEEIVRAKLGMNISEWEFVKDVYFNKGLRKMCYDQKLAPFILQDIITCIENADIFVTRDHREEYKSDYHLIRSLARVVTLILHPGLLTPTKIERCMQIAITAKLNSGCLSRQVGAVVTDGDYNILSLGWNDAPCGVESCIRRNFYDLLKKDDSDGYSEYELYDEVFRKYLDTINSTINESIKNLQGLPLAFCFKDIYQDIIRQRDQIYTRALHGEERALAACSNERAKGGYLFTTSSPCELCAKKAKEARISKIYYIEQYPGISYTHIIASGDKKNRAEYELFVGAVGAAYVKLYTPLIPYKDELAALNFSIPDIYKAQMKPSEKEKKGTDKAEKHESVFVSLGQVEQSPRSR